MLLASCRCNVSATASRRGNTGRPCAYGECGLILVVHAELMYIPCNGQWLCVVWIQPTAVQIRAEAAERAENEVVATQPQHGPASDRFPKCREPRIATFLLTGDPHPPYPPPTSHLSPPLSGLSIIYFFGFLCFSRAYGQVSKTIITLSVSQPKLLPCLLQPLCPCHAHGHASMVPPYQNPPSRRVLFPSPPPTSRFARSCKRPCPSYALAVRNQVKTTSPRIRARVWDIPRLASCMRSAHAALEKRFHGDTDPFPSVAGGGRCDSRVARS